MKEYLKIDEIDIPITIQSYKNSKTVKILYKSGYLKITKPKWYSNREIIKYLKQNSKEIYDKYLNYIEEDSIGLTDTKSGQISKVLYKGKEYAIIIKKIPEQKISIDLKDGYFEINIYERIDNENNFNELVKQSLINIMKQLAKQYIPNRVYEISKEININYGDIHIKDCKTMWGSCSSKGNLNFNFRLISMPLWVIDTIIIHELCHRKVMKHNEEFWKLVYTYCKKETYDNAKKWIKENEKIINII